MVEMVNGRRGGRGQVLVVFTLAIVVIMSIVGLVLDGGSVFAQRRDQQNVADLAAMAAVTAYLNTTGSAGAKQVAGQVAAQQIALANGYTNNPSAKMAVQIMVAGDEITGNATVNIGKRHRNNFAGLVGMPSWDVAVTASAVSSVRPNGARGVLPLIFNVAAFEPDAAGNPPLAVCNVDLGLPCTSQTFQLPGTGNEDVPQDATQFNFTVFCAASSKDFDGDGNPDDCNANSSDVKEYIWDEGTSTTVYVDDDIGPLNAGTHADIFKELDDFSVGESFPVPVVDSDGTIVGFAYFFLEAIEGSPDRVVKGYFETPYAGDRLEVSNAHAAAGIDLSNVLLKLTN